MYVSLSADLIVILSGGEASTLAYCGVGVYHACWRMLTYGGVECRLKAAKIFYTCGGVLCIYIRIYIYIFINYIYVKVYNVCLSLCVSVRLSM